MGIIGGKGAISSSNESTEPASSLAAVLASAAVVAETSSVSQPVTAQVSSIADTPKPEKLPVSCPVYLWLVTLQHSTLNQSLTFQQHLRSCGIHTNLSVLV